MRRRRPEWHPLLPPDGWMWNGDGTQMVKVSLVEDLYRKQMEGWDVPGLINRRNAEIDAEDRKKTKAKLRRMNRGKK